MSQPHRTSFPVLSPRYRTFVAGGHTPLSFSRRAFAIAATRVAGASKTCTTSGRNLGRRRPGDGRMTAVRLRPATSQNGLKWVCMTAVALAVVNRESDKPMTSLPPVPPTPTIQTTAVTGMADADITDTQVAETHVAATDVADTVATNASPHPSASLQTANARLLALRAAHTQSKQSHLAHTTSPRPFLPLNHAIIPPHLLAGLPHHLGWESAAVTTGLRRRLLTAHTAIQTWPDETDTVSPYGMWETAIGQTGVRQTAVGQTAIGQTAVSPTADIPPPPPRNDALRPETLKLYPSLALAMLRTGQTACGRLWLLLRHLDSQGQGCWSLTAVHRLLTERDSRFHLCGQRQLRKHLQKGSGLFWQRDRSHLWLTSTVKVAARLGVSRLAGRPIVLPLTILTQPIGLVRAHLYASFHSGRQSDGGSEASPISRASLTAMSGVCRRTQHSYERRARVQVQRHLAIGPALGGQAAEDAAWQQQGTAVFVFADKKGRQGRPGRRYLAWQLPNTYRGPHARLGRGRQRHLNRQLVDLRDNGDAGNGRHYGEEVAEDRPRYAANGAVAEQCLRRWPGASIYWRAQGTPGTGIWYLLAAQAGDG